MWYTASLDFENLPPACSMVKATSTAGFFSTGCMSTGMPRPWSSTSTEPSLRSVTVILLPNPESASSTALSIASCTMCSGCTVWVYIPGMRRTGSRPLSAWIAEASYTAGFAMYLVPLRGLCPRYCIRLREAPDARRHRLGERPLFPELQQLLLRSQRGALPRHQAFDQARDGSIQLGFVAERFHQAPLAGAARV